jgi:Tol biopolymer transport system component
MSLLAVAAGVLALAAAPAASAAADPFAGDQRWIAYQTSYHADTGWGPEGVWLIHPDGTGDHQIGVGANEEQLLPSWSPDGSTIAFASRGGSHEPLFEYDLATGSTRQLFACDGDCLGDDEPAYSPDGHTVAFIRALAPLTEFGPSDCSIWLGDVLTGAVQRLTDNGSCDRENEPRWSPDGRQLTYWRERYDLNTGEVSATAVFVLDVSTGQQTRITDWGDDFGEPDWSPDGHWIVMATHPLHSFNFGSYESNLYRVHPDGSGLEPLTFYEGRNVRATQPDYTPDGRSIVFTAVTPNSRELWILPADGGKRYRVTNGGIATHGTMQPA